ncbi:MAG: DUF5362 family protein [Kiritimatiellaeota bacterium]|nr:DUF5362 family protein [Kiritimatiellota bacterium]
MDKMWYYSDNGTERKGPVSDSELRQLQLPPATLVWSEGMTSWAPLSNLSAPTVASAAAPLRLATPTPAAVAAPVHAPGGSTPPESLSKWMAFVGVMNIIGGVFACLSCIYLPYGIPMIMSGAALLGAKNLIAAMPAVDPGMAAFLEQLRKAFKLTGWAYILMMIMAVLIMVAYGIFFATMFGTMMRNMPR